MLNRAVLTGRLTSDPECRTTQSNLSVCQFTLAVDEAKGKPANYISCVVWRQGADFLGQYARKGDLIAVDGRITTRSYDKDGHKVFVTEVVADKVEIMAHKGQNKQGDNFTGSQQTRSQTDFTRNQGEYYQQPMNEPVGLDIGPDDLPF